MMDFNSKQSMAIQTIPNKYAEFQMNSKILQSKPINQ